MSHLLFSSFLAVLLVAFNSCADNKMKKESTSERSQDIPSSEVYVCPMHPEVIGKKGDKCPKCGMALVLQESDQLADHQMIFSIKSPPVAGERVELWLKPTASEKDEPVELSVQHEKKIHLIVVSDDLSWFDHIHPEDSGNGNYTVNEIFPFGGKYHLYADYKPVNGKATVDTFSLNVEGKKTSAKSFNSNKLTGQSGDLSFELQPTESVMKTGSNHFTGIVRRNGKEIDAKTLDDYLGAKAHIVAISVADKSYQHIHPVVGKGRFDLEANFQKQGIYRWWVQFMSEGKLHTIDLVTRVNEGSGSNISSDHSGHNH